jgi:PPOX class probable F420-dependent enzyme
MGEGQVGGLWAPQRRALTTGLVLTVTFIASEALAVVTVMPVVVRDLGGLRWYGWAFSGFFLGSVVGIVVAGREADRRGPAVPFVGGVALFGAGLAVAGLAPSMAVLVAGRVLQGLGAGAVPSVAYASIGRSLPGPLQARMMAILSTAWVAPGLVGPAISAEVAHLFGWRWVFLGLLPVVAVAGSIAVPALVRIGAAVPSVAVPSAGAQAHRLTDGIRTALGVTMLLAGLTLAAGSGTVLYLGAGLALIAAGAAAGLPPLRRLVPAGTLTGRPGLPATIASRGLLTFAFFGADAYVTLAVTAVRHRSPVVAGIAVTGATVAWTAGAWIQARLSDEWPGQRLVRTGLVIILAGIAGMAAVLQPGVPVAEGLAAWTVAGLGMGLAYAPLTLMMLRKAPPGQEGQTSASLNLADVLGTAIGIGVGGAAVTAAASSHLPLGIAAAFAASAAVALLGLALTRRLPAGTGSVPQPAGEATEHRRDGGCCCDMVQDGFAEFLAGQRQGVLVTLRPNGRPQLSNVNYAWYPEEQTIKISTTEDRAKTANLRRDPRASFHVTSGDFWSYVVVDGQAELSAVARDTHDAAVEELIDLYRAVQGEHPDWDDYRAAMVRDRRLVVRLRAEQAYGFVHR